MHYIYVIWNKIKESLYIGYTEDIEERLKYHRYTKQADLIYYEAYKSEKDAHYRERRLKQYGSAWRGLKERLKDSIKQTA